MTCIVYLSIFVSTKRAINWRPIFDLTGQPGDWANECAIHRI